MGRSGRGMGMAVVAIAVLAGGAHGQQRAPRAAAYVGGAGVGAAPLGDFDYYVDEGWGGQIYGALPMGAQGQLRLRGDLGGLVYGNQRLSYCYPVPVGCRIGTELNTYNWVLFGGLGPEVALATGAIEPYLNASFGFVYFATTSHLSSYDGYDHGETTTNFSDADFAWRAGGGIRFRMTDGAAPVFLDLGVEHQENGVVDYLTEGDIVDHPDGNITLFPKHGEANFLAFRLGVTVAIPSSLHP